MCYYLRQGGDVFSAVCQQDYGKSYWPDFHKTWWLANSVRQNSSYT